MYEYNFAVASAQSAGKWHEFSEYADRYYLQYRTAKDERVREEHAILDGITLPIDDKFWDEFFPPNGWNYRCEAIQVSKKRYEPSNPSEALARGRAATYKPNADGVNKAAIFRFNPGKEQRIFPKKHPYFPKGCGDCGLNQYATGKGKPQYTACRKIQKLAKKEREKKAKKDIAGLILTNEKFTNNTVFISPSSLRNYLKHSETAEEISILQDFVKNKLPIEVYEPPKEVDYLNHTEGNYNKKINRGVVDFHYYKVTYNNKVYVLSFENLKKTL